MINSLKSLPEKERPREKAISFGIQNLTDSELLAVVLRSGNKGCDVLETSRLIMSKYQNFRTLAKASFAELTNIPSIGKIKALEIKACLEIAKRFQETQILPGAKLSCSIRVYEYFKNLLCDEKKEKFYCVLLDSKSHIISKEMISIGSLNSAIVHPREVFLTAIKESAHSVILVHNHPSGDPTPSNEDISITERLVKAGKIVGIKIIDHIIIGNNCYVSFVEKGLLIS